MASDKALRVWDVQHIPVLHPFGVGTPICSRQIGNGLSERTATQDEGFLVITLRAEASFPH